MREVNATSPRNIGTNSMKDCVHKLLETSCFSFLLTIDALSQIERSVDLGFFPKKGENGASCSIEAGVTDSLCKKQGSTVPSRSGKQMSKVA